MTATPEEVLKDSFFSGLAPDPVLKVSEWAAEKRVLSSKSSAEPGPWNNDRTPYAIEIMDCLSNGNEIERVILVKGTQIGGTEIGLNWTGYIVDEAPGPMMTVMPTEKTLKRHSKLRISPMIKETPALRAKIKDQKSRDSSNTMYEKDFEGGTLIFATAGSSSELASTPIRYLNLEECDKYPPDSGGEGSPTELAIKRTKTFGNKKKIYFCSSPGLEISSIVQREYDLSDQRKCFIPCPHCEFMQTLKFKNLIYESDGPVLLDYDVKYRCENPECGVLIDEFYKTKMLIGHKWIAQNPGAQNGKVAGFQLNSLYSPYGWHSWSDIVEEWLKATKPQVDTEKLKTFVNTVLGETWRERGDAPEFERLYERRIDYKIGTVPLGGIFVTCCVDVQKDSLQAEIVAWGRGKRSWTVDFIVMPGDTGDEKTWDQLDELLMQTFPYEHGDINLEIPIKFMLIDSGYNSDMVYWFCRKHSKNRVAPSKGYDELQTLVGIPKAVDVVTRGRQIRKKRRGVAIWPVGVSVGKTRFYGQLRLNAGEDGELNPPGYCQFPKLNKDYFKQLTSEELRTITKRNGQKKYEWHRLRRNEALDCRVLNMAAAEIIGISRFNESHWEKLELQMGQAKIVKKKKKKKKGMPTQNISGRPKDYWD